MDITLQWTPNSEPDVAGYKVFYREESESYNYSDPYWETIEPKCTIYDLDITKTYYFVVRAFDVNGFTSTNSNEVALMEGAAVNSTGSGEVSGGGGGGGCFIATAAYGSLLEPHVRILCKFRDRYLLTNSPGKIFVKYYYKHSPPAADFISKHNGLRAVVCAGLLPLVGLSWIFLKVGAGSATFIILLVGMGSVYLAAWINNTRYGNSDDIQIRGYV
jgi:hypothetical protein